MPNARSLPTHVLSISLSLVAAGAACGQAPPPSEPTAAEQQRGEKSSESKPAPLPPGVPPATIVLTTGEVLRGEITSQDDTTVHLKHPVMGDLPIPRASIKSIVDTPKNAPAKLPDPAPPIVPAPPPPPDPESFLDGWKGHFDAGITGSSGNTETFGGHVEVGVKRVTSLMETEFGAGYEYGTSGGEKDKSRGEFDGRNDWRFGEESPWAWYAQGRLEFDEFQAYKWRASASTGPVYTFVENDTMTLKGRIGIGGSYEWAGPDPKETFVPEGLAGIDFAYKIDERQSIFANFEYLPSLRNPPEFRTDLKAGYQIMVDPTSKMFLKLGADDRYESDPGMGIKRNDVDYFLTVGWEF